MSDQVRIPVERKRPVARISVVCLASRPKVSWHLSPPREAAWRGSVPGAGSPRFVEARASPTQPDFRTRRAYWPTSRSSGACGRCSRHGRRGTSFGSGGDPSPCRRRDPGFNPGPSRNAPVLGTARLLPRPDFPAPTTRHDLASVWRWGENSRGWRGVSSRSGIRG